MKTSLGAVAALSLALAVPAGAAPVDLDTSAGRIIPVFGGCGPYSHRGPFGGCRPGGQWGGYIRGASCPAGFHIGPYGRRCWPN